MVDQVDKKKRKYWSEHDMLRKVETYARVHFEGKYKDVYTTPYLGSAARLRYLRNTIYLQRKGQYVRRRTVN